MRLLVAGIVAGIVAGSIMVGAAERLPAFRAERWVDRGIRDAIARAVKGEFVRWDTPLYASPDGSLTIIIDASVMPVKDDQGRVVFLACEGRDITDKKELRHTPILLLSAKADEQLMVELLDRGAQDFIVKPFSERDLRVRVRNLVLGADARAVAESANRAKDEFLAMLGHELRNPLSPILTALQLMKLRAEPGSEREREVIERQVSPFTRLVDDLLDVSRIARGRVEVKTEIVEVADVVAKAIEMASPLLEQRNHTLKVDVPRRGLRIKGDTTRLAQVISNLLTNAAKYTPPNGVVTVRTE